MNSAKAGATRFDLVTFGETMIRLSPPEGARLEATSCLIVDVGGAELSVAQAAARLGLKTAWVSCLPDNPLGRIVADRAGEQGVATDFIKWVPGGRMGLYFVEDGAAPRSPEVHYDRRHSAVSRLQPGEIDWSAILPQTRIFHTSGITPALGPGIRRATREALEFAGGLDCLVSYDLNYRAKLWSLEEARRTQVPYLEYIDILFTSVSGADQILDVRAGDEESLAADLCRRFGLTACILSSREEIGTKLHRIGAVMIYRGEVYRGREQWIEVVDRLGGGDSFCAAILAGIAAGDPGAAMATAGIYSALQHTHPGDFNYNFPWEAAGLQPEP